MKLIAVNFNRGNQPTADDHPDRDDLTHQMPLQEAVKVYRATQEAVAAVKRARLTIPHRPLAENGVDLNPKLTSDLASTPSHTLGKLLTQFTAIADYAAYAAALADIERVIEEHALEYVTARVRLEKSGTVQEKADKTAVDPRVRAASATYFERMAIATLTQTLLENYERDLSAVSREITRRGNEMSRTT